MKAWKLFWGLGLILVAALIVVEALGITTPLVAIIGGVSIFEIIAGLLIIALVIDGIVRGKFSSVFFLLAFLFMLFEENIAYICKLENENIINNWLVLLVALLLSAGVAILSNPSKKTMKKRNSGGNIEYNGNSAECNLGSSSVYVDCEIFSPSHIENNLGSCSVYFENAEKYQGGKTLYIENSLASMCINVPSGWIVKTNIENNLGSFVTQVDEKPNEFGPILYIKGENNTGSLSIRFV